MVEGAEERGGECKRWTDAADEGRGKGETWHSIVYGIM